MTRQIASGVGSPSAAVLEERIRRLENAVAGLTRTVDALARRVAELTDAPPEPHEPPHGASGDAPHRASRGSPAEPSPATVREPPHGASGERAHEAPFESRQEPHHGSGQEPPREPPRPARPLRPAG